MFWRSWKKRKSPDGYITIVYDPEGNPILIHDSLSGPSTHQDEPSTATSAAPSDICSSVFDTDWEMVTASPPLHGLWDSGPDSFGISTFMD